MLRGKSRLSSGTLLALILALGGLMTALIAQQYRSRHTPYQSVSKPAEK